MRFRQALLAAALLGASTVSPPLRADTNTDEIAALKHQIEQLSEKVLVLEQKLNAQGEAPPVTNAAPAGADPRVEQLDQKVRVLERKAELDQEAAAERKQTEPRVSLNGNGFTLSSADTNFVLKLKGVLQVDSRTFVNDNPASTGNDGFLLRRARPILDGTVFRDFDFSFVPDFGGTGSPTIYDAYVNYRYQPALQLRIGKFKTPIGLEQLVTDRDLLFNERSLVTDLVPNRDVGAQLWGDVSGGVLSYAAGIFNGVGDARNSSNGPFDDNKTFAGRVFVQPLKKSNAPLLQGLGVGLAGSYGSVTHNATGLPNNSGFTTDGQQQFFVYTNGVVADGVHWRLSPQATYTYGSFGLLGEYAISDQRVALGAAARDLENTAWEVSAQWVLTGEPAGFSGLVPKHPFDPRSGGWGAWQLVARYGELDVDRGAFPVFASPTANAHGAEAWSIGLNWWLNQNVRLLTSFSHTTFEGGGAGTSAPGLVSHQPENVVFTRLQLAF
ncbi:MAG: porin [Verrucomicrobiota bacterium]|jgi:phosphate-selective porin OprO/OprP